jgi:hypothetical protein
MNPIDLNELATRVHEANEKWWHDPLTKQPIKRDRDELLMLVVTELAEACEGARRNCTDNHLPHRKMEEVEMADAVIRMLDMAGGFGEGVDDFCDHTFDADSCKGKDLLEICKIVSSYTDTTDYHENNANIISYIRGYCKKWKLDLWAAFEEKMAYNATRADHTHEARLQADGKKW